MRIVAKLILISVHTFFFKPLLDESNTLLSLTLGLFEGCCVGGGASVGIVEVHDDAGPKQLSFGPLAITM